MENFIIISLACAAISFTVTTTSIFLGFREMVSRWHPKIEELIHCPWCLNHYVSVLFVLFPWEWHGWFIFLASWFSTVGLGGIVHFVLLRTYEPVAKIMLQRKIDGLKKRVEQALENGKLFREDLEHEDFVDRVDR